MLKQKVSYISGYKNIPSDWIISPLGEVVEVVSGGTPSTKKEEYWNGEVLWATPTDISKSSKYITETERRISSRGLEKSSAILLPPQSVLVTSRATIGLQAINPYPIATNQGFKSLVPKSNVDHEFLYYLVFLLRKEMIRRASGSTFLEISKKDVENINILLPPLEEQQKIASILSTWDEAISLYKRMVEYKKIYRTSLLESFFKDLVLFDKEVEWYEYKLGDIGSFRTSSVDKVNRDEEEEVYILNYMDVYKNPFIDKDLNLEKGTASSTQLKTTDVQKGDIFFTPSSETRDDIGHASIIVDELENTVYSYHLVRFRIHSNNVIDKYFAPYILNNNYVRKQMSRMCTGSTRYTISINDFEQIMIKIPDLNTQKEMSNIFQLLDREISYLDKLIIQLQEQKRGLMQLLLTGKVRV